MLFNELLEQLIFLLGPGVLTSVSLLVSLVLFLVLLITFGLLNSLFEYVQPLRHSLLVIAAQAVDALYNAAQMSQLLVVGWAYAA